MNPYEVLGVSADATQDEIKKAFKRAAQDNHPDRNKGCEVSANRRMKAINQAYETLDDPILREAFNEVRDHKKAAKLMDEANRFIKEKFDEYFTEPAPPGNPLRYIKDHFVQATVSHVQTIATQEQALEAFKIFRGRFKVRGHINIFEDSLNCKIEYIENTIESHEQGLRVQKIVEQLLKVYRYENEIQLTNSPSLKDQLGY